MNREKIKELLAALPRKLRTRQGLIALSCAAVVLLAVAFHLANGWRVEFSLPSGETDTVECHAAYEPPAVSAVLKGNLIFRRGKPLQTARSGEYNTGAVGAYTLTWRAGAFGINGRCVRTVQVVDTVPPVITLTPETREYILPGTPYDDPGYTAADAVDGDLTARVVRTVKDDVVTYTVTDSAGNTATVNRTIPYNDPEPPVITLKGKTSITVLIGEGGYTEPGYTASDNLDGDITDRVKVTGTVDSKSPGVYTLEYTVEDSYHNKTSASRTVIVRYASSAVAQTSGGGSSAGGKAIYLTFDDGPGPYTAKLLDILAAYNVKATFFVVGTGNTDLIAREAAEGHTVAIHSMTHNYGKIYASEDAYFADLQAMNEIIKQKTGSYATLLRFPGGSSNTVSKFNPGIMSRLTKAVREAGFQYFDWNVSSGDAGETTSSDQVYRNVINGVSGRNSAVVLQHDIKNFSVNAVERIIQWGLENGYTFLPLTADSPTAHHGVNN